MKEIWLDIEDWYAISNEGKLASYHNGRWGRLDVPIIMSPGINADGYQRVRLHTNEGVRNVFVHDLVLEAFVGPRPKGMECRHLDGDPSNNVWPDNLCWGTRLENVGDQIKHGVHAQAYRPSGELIAEIKRRRAKRESLQSIADDLGLYRNFVTGIVNNVHWSQRKAQEAV